MMKFHYLISLSGLLLDVIYLPEQYVYRLKYLKRRIRYSYGHPGSFNPAVITNKEAHMIYGNMDKETGTSQATGFAKKKRSKISDFFSKTEQCCIEGKFGISMPYLTCEKITSYCYT